MVLKALDSMGIKDGTLAKKFAKGRIPFFLFICYNIFMPVSKTYGLAIVGIVTALAPVFGFELVDGQATEQFIAVIVFLGIAIDRFWKGDISVIGLRKK